jgi:excinuclease ABC subunit C
MPRPSEAPEALREAVRTAPDRPGVYRFFGVSDRLLYVGKAKHLRRRLRAYLDPESLPARLARAVRALERVEIIETRSEAEALLLEASLIKAGDPQANVRLRDARWFPHVAIGAGPFPRLSVHVGRLEPGVFYVGPFADRGAAEGLRRELESLFRLRTCTDAVFSVRSRPCLLHQIGRCSAPCVGRASEEAYARQVSEARAFLSAGHVAWRRHLADRMAAAAKALDFEAAAILRDRIRALDRLSERTPIMGSGLVDADVFALARDDAGACVQLFLVRGGRAHGGRALFPDIPPETPDGEAMAAIVLQAYADRPPPPLVICAPLPDSADVLAAALSARAGLRVRVSAGARGGPRRLLEEIRRNAQEALERRLSAKASQRAALSDLATRLGLPETPRRVELYDNSHLGGTGMVGAMLVVGPDGVEPSQGRIFRDVGPVAAGDDCAMMEAVLRRRFRPGHAPPPDLLIVDGGAGQRDAALRALKACGVSVPVLGISKGPDRNAGRETLHWEGRTLDLPARDSLLFALQRWRDAVHDKAIGAQRRGRLRAVSRSALDGVSGLGPAKRKLLIARFGSGRAAVLAPLQDLLQVPGIGPELAARIQAAGLKS